MVAHVQHHMLEITLVTVQHHMLVTMPVITLAHVQHHMLEITLVTV
jgi:hypothetical protein